jgi:putative DNA primase/helicase
MRLFKPGGNRAASSAFEARLRALLDIPPNRDEQGGLAPALLDFDAEAFEVSRRFHDDVEREQRTGGEMADVRDVASKAADNVARLAALFHMYRHGPSGRIGADSVQAAAEIVAWHLYQIRAFLDGVAAPPDMSNARKLDDWLIARCRELGTDSIPLRTVQNSGPNPVRNRQSLEATLAVLVDADRVRLMQQVRPKLLAVNPALLRGQP